LFLNLFQILSCSTLVTEINISSHLITQSPASACSISLCRSHVVKRPVGNVSRLLSQHGKSSGRLIPLPPDTSRGSLERHGIVGAFVSMTSLAVIRNRSFCVRPYSLRPGNDQSKWRRSSSTVMRL